MFASEDRFTDKKDKFEQILKKEIVEQNVEARKHKVANKQLVYSYPCVCHHVSIQDAGEIEFYFDITFDDMYLPLLGGSFIDDCAYSHAINSNINITAIKERAGESYYIGHNVLDFDKVVAEYDKELNI